MTKNRYNLLDEPWIPVAGAGRVGLLRLLTDRECKTLGGTPVQKIAILKLLLAIAQAAATPETSAEWAALGPESLSERCTTYLEHWREAFWLYGDKPFLQMPACSRAEVKPYGTAMPHIASGNTTLLTDLQMEPDLPDALRAMLLIEQMAFALGGKKPDAKLVLSKGYSKGATAKPGPGVCHMGLLHTFLLGSTFAETVWLNLLTEDTIRDIRQWETGTGVPPWESMPEGEDCPIARRLKTSLMGRLVPLSRFCLLTQEGLRYTEGIVHPDYQERMIDPSAAADKTKSKVKMLWASTEKKPWRQLTALLAFLDADRHGIFECLNLQQGLPRLSLTALPRFGIWSGGIRVSSNAGEQYVTGSDDYIESEVWLETDVLSGDVLWFPQFKQMMTTLEQMGNRVYGATKGYFSELKVQADQHAAEASGAFWQLVEPLFQDIVTACDNAEQTRKLLGRCTGFARTAYDNACPRGTARQFEAWARHRPDSEAAQR